MHMKGEHPIDDLFARGLRDAESTPPAAVWEGIDRERNWAHITLLKLRRHACLLAVWHRLLRGNAQGDRENKPDQVSEHPPIYPGQREVQRTISL